MRDPNKPKLFLMITTSGSQKFDEMKAFNSKLWVFSPINWPKTLLFDELIKKLQRNPISSCKF